jgi:hypothetical protein
MDLNSLDPTDLLPTDMHVIDYFNNSICSQEKHLLVAIHLAAALLSLRK